MVIERFRPFMMTESTKARGDSETELLSPVESRRLPLSWSKLGIGEGGEFEQVYGVEERVSFGVGLAVRKADRMQGGRWWREGYNAGRRWEG